MDNQTLTKLLDHKRWLLNHGMADGVIENQLFMFGSLVHVEIKAVELMIKTEDKRVEYILYFDKSLLDQLDRYKILLSNYSNIDKFRRQRFILRKKALVERTMKKCAQLEQSGFFNKLRSVSLAKKSRKLCQKMEERYTALNNKREELMKRIDLLVRKGNEQLDFNRVLGDFIGDYCGPEWKVDIKVVDVANYVEGYGKEEKLPRLLSDQYLDQ